MSKDESEIRLNMNDFPSGEGAVGLFFQIRLYFLFLFEIKCFR